MSVRKSSNSWLDSDLSELAEQSRDLLRLALWRDIDYTA